MIKVHAAQQRGHFRNEWLDARFSFQFGAYKDSNRGPYSDLLVLNEDLVEPGGGFRPHAHENVEVMSYPLSGGVVHEDSLGSRELIEYGDVHLMRAGSGIVHSEMNASQALPERHVQWWIAPIHKNSRPFYQKAKFSIERKLDRLCLIGSQDGRDGSLTIDQDIRVYVSIVRSSEFYYELPVNRRAYLHVLDGSLKVGNLELMTGDGAHIENVSALPLASDTQAEIVIFELR